MTLGSVLSRLFERLADFVPFVVVRPWQQAIRLRLGRITKLCGPNDGILGTGLHLCWPLIGDFVVEDVTPVAVETSLQTLTTLDGEVVVVGFVLRYGVRDLGLLWRSLDNARDSAVNAVEGSIGRWVCGLRWRGEDPFEVALETAVQQEMVGRFEAWGLELEDLAPHTLCRARAFRLFGERGTSLEVR